MENAGNILVVSSFVVIFVSWIAALYKGPGQVRAFKQAGAGAIGFGVNLAW